MNKVGFMQGRLSPILDNKIQAFPFNYWEQEFAIAKELGIQCMEWTLDYPNLRNNPLLLNKKKKKILRIINRFNLGGPTYNAAYLTKYLEDDYETLLVGGNHEESEKS